MNKDKVLYNLSSFARAVKTARTNDKVTREQLSEKLGISVRHLAQIENKGQHPSFQVFYELATMFNLSVDQFFYPDTKPIKTSQRKTLDAKLDAMDDKDLSIVDGTATAILNSH